MNPKKKLWITLSAAAGCILLLLGVLIFVLSVVNPRTQMQGYVVGYDGTVKEEISFSIRTKRVLGSKRALELTFDLPEDFPYRLDTLTSISSPSDKMPFYTFAGYCTNTATGASTFIHCVYGKDASMLYIDWNDGTTDYFIASGNSDKSAQEIWAYFRAYIN